MIRPLIRQRVDLIHLRSGQRLRRRILHDKELFTVCLKQTLSCERIRAAVLGVKTFRILPFICQQRLVMRQLHSIVNILPPARFINGSVHKRDIPDVQTALQRFRNLNNAALPHPVGDQIRARIQQYRAFQAVRPVIIVGEAPQTRLNTADNHRRVPERPPDQIAIGNRGIIRPFSHHTSGRVGIARAPLF